MLCCAIILTCCRYYEPDRVPGTGIIPLSSDPVHNTSKQEDLRLVDRPKNPTFSSSEALRRPSNKLSYVLRLVDPGARGIGIETLVPYCLLCYLCAVILYCYCYLIWLLASDDGITGAGEMRWYTDGTLGERKVLSSWVDCGNTTSK